MEDCNRTAELITIILRLRLTECQQKILIAMASDANPQTGLMQVRIERLAWLMDISVSQARRELQDVVSAGLLKVVWKSPGRVPSIHQLCPEAAQPKPIKAGSERVDYMRPSQVEVGFDRVSDSQPFPDKQGDDRDNDPNPIILPEAAKPLQVKQGNGGLPPTLPIKAGSERVGRAQNLPPHPPPGIQEQKQELKAAESLDARAPVDDLLDWLKKKDPIRQYDRADLDNLITTYTADWIFAAFEQAYSLPTPPGNPTGYVVVTVRGWTQTGKPERRPPSVPPVSPNGKPPPLPDSPNNLTPAALGLAPTDDSGKPWREDTLKFIFHQRKQKESVQ